MGELVFCLHADGGTHVDLVAKEAPEKEACCEHAKVSVTPIACSPCTDLIFESVDLESIRPNEFEAAPAKLAAVTTSSHLLPESAIRSGRNVVVLPPTRGPPDVEPDSELIRRVIILRL
jgi:hypothetical protein